MICWKTYSRFVNMDWRFFRAFELDDLSTCQLHFYESFSKYQPANKIEMILLGVRWPLCRWLRPLQYYIRKLFSSTPFLRFGSWLSLQCSIFLTFLFYGTCNSLNKAFWMWVTLQSFLDNLTKYYGRNLKNEHSLGISHDSDITFQKK